MGKFKSLLEEFKAFIARGNVIDLAVGVIIGSAFSNIVKALVDCVMMPIIGIILGGIDFSNLSFNIGNTPILIGTFFQAVFNFLIIAVVIFSFVKIISLAKHKQKEEAPTVPETPADIKLLTEIRDLLKK